MEEAEKRTTAGSKMGTNLQITLGTQNLTLRRNGINFFLGNTHFFKPLNFQQRRYVRLIDLRNNVSSCPLTLSHFLFLNKKGFLGVVIIEIV